MRRWHAAPADRKRNAMRGGVLCGRLRPFHFQDEHQGQAVRVGIEGHGYLSLSSLFSVSAEQLLRNLLSHVGWLASP